MPDSTHWVYPLVLVVLVGDGIVEEIQSIDRISVPVTFPAADGSSAFCCCCILLQMNLMLALDIISLAPSGKESYSR